MTYSAYDGFEHVPMMFRAQVRDRAQLHFIPSGKDPDIFKWTEEWLDGTRPEAPEFDESVKTHSYTIGWRLVTNSGQDNDLIRPVMGAGGWPFIPGSSMKGAFRRVCPAAERDRYCGQAFEDEFRPGILRFHGGYPTSDQWQNHLVDVVHPQQDRQVKRQGRSAALAQISLYRTEIIFGFSSSFALDEAEWQQIFKIWESALFAGIGCRVSCGYGLFDGLATLSADDTAPKPQKVLHSAQLKGHGIAPILVQNRTPEFRPNLIKAAFRGHALRLFGGLVREDATAERLVQTLFGGIRDKGAQGLLSLDVNMLNDETKWLQEVKTYNSPATFYDVECELRWKLTKSTEHEAELKNLIDQLTQFALLLGGFGNSWRRADHSLFMPQYKRHPIGCHWQWLDEIDNKIQGLKDVTEVIDSTQAAFTAWKALFPDLLRSDADGKNPTDRWREVWKSERVQVWGRKAKSAKDSKVIPWLHDKSNSQRNQRSKSHHSRSRSPSRPQSKSSSLAMQRFGEMEPARIYQTTVSGYVGERTRTPQTLVGQIWHRMYPLTGAETGKYLELLTFFPDSKSEDTASAEFKAYLAKQREFEKLWGR
ncbi:MAG: RAMP superfamily protein [Leptolyngbya sp. SIO4C5]|nr:RAMP superfamily protein [Leptolyngbya sp. SIO4C5]